MGRKRRANAQDFDSDPYDDYDEDYDDEFDDIGDLARDFYSTDWEDPSGSERRFSTRRKIERRNELKELHSLIEDWDDYDFSNEW